jgi:hypothetical protein
MQKRSFGYGIEPVMAAGRKGRKHKEQIRYRRQSKGKPIRPPHQELESKAADKQHESRKRREEPEPERQESRGSGKNACNQEQQQTQGWVWGKKMLQSKNGRVSFILISSP